MYSIPNGLNSYGDDTMNLHGSVPIQMNSSYGDRETKMFRSIFNTPDIRNHHGVFSSSHASNCYQDSHIYSSSFGFNNSHAAYEMRTNMVSDAVDYLPISNNFHLSQVSITQTITRRYSAIVPTISSIIAQNEYERDMYPNISSPSFYSQTFVENQSNILNPTPLSTHFPRNVDQFSFSPNHHHVPNRRPVIKRQKFKEILDGFDFEENGVYDGRTHSLPYEKYGPYTCPKCEDVFDTSQKFAAHISSVHYKNETVEEKAKRYNARNKKRIRKIDQTMHGESQMIQPEETIVEDSGGSNNNIASEIEASQQQLVVKEEPVYDVVY
ncbi:unnamed protein product [Eruca vesicaria subsp. sativa]|uniref:C2H2-type domain-containing protein n=1 Tax=Eruca vesicaria subsp. sativa TaxID=29727 RepID=A0ABC8L9E6_ERUVS|nr:unnamed protein product [Eruca vesicaria subsp. sativa]